MTTAKNRAIRLKDLLGLLLSLLAGLWLPSYGVGLRAERCPGFDLLPDWEASSTWLQRCEKRAGVARSTTPRGHPERRC